MKPVSATVTVKVAQCCKCSNQASVTMVDDAHNIIQVCPEHHIGRIQELMIGRIVAILESPELHNDITKMDGLSALAYIRHALLGGAS